jgi:hypothetical protein
MKKIIAFMVVAFAFFFLMGHTQQTNDNPDIIKETPAYKLTGILYEA